MKQYEILPHLFRTEYSKIVAVLCKVYHIQPIEIAEDIAGETFLKASESWPFHGMPENPTAWLYTVAKNKAKDYFKHTSIFETKIKNDLKENEIVRDQGDEFSRENISDSQLAMMFAVGNPAISSEAQICLALQILCGFSVEEIAGAFLAHPETIKKRLHRARSRLRKDNFQIRSLGEREVASRLDTVLKTLYLLFNEGYFSKTNDQLIRKDLCSEAIRLTLVLTENPWTDLPQTNALLSLMCFQSSRLAARTDENGGAILFDEQNKNLWDTALIEKGNDYMIRACKGHEMSKYHLEAAIAYWHTTPAGENKWPHILSLYNQLILIEYSPITALNRIFAYAKVYGHQEAIKQPETLQLVESSYYHGLLGYLYTGINFCKATEHYERAIKLTRSKVEKQTLAKELFKLKEQKL